MTTAATSREGRRRHRRELVPLGVARVGWSSPPATRPIDLGTLDRYCRFRGPFSPAQKLALTQSAGIGGAHGDSVLAAAETAVRSAHPDPDRNGGRQGVGRHGAGGRPPTPGFWWSAPAPTTARWAGMSRITHRTHAPS